MLEYYLYANEMQTTSYGENFGNIGPYWGSKDPKKTPKKGSFVFAESERKIWKSLTWQQQMLYWWNLPQLCIFIRVLIEKLLEPEIHFFGLI